VKKLAERCGKTDDARRKHAIKDGDQFRSDWHITNIVPVL